jgi:hypothetical protein
MLAGTEFETRGFRSEAVANGPVGDPEIPLDGRLVERSADERVDPATRLFVADLRMPALR